MKVRQVNSMLWLTTAACLGLGALSLVFGFVLPLDVTSEGQATSFTSGQTPTTRLAIESFDQIVSRSFRGASNDGPSASRSSTGTQIASIQSSSAPVLVGTIGDSLAMFRMPDGSIALKGVGDDLEGSSVVAIRPEQVDLQSSGRRTTLSKEKPPAPPGVSLEGNNP